MFWQEAITTYTFQLLILARPPSLSRFDAQLNGGCVTGIQGGSGAGGAVLGTSVKLFGATNNAGKT